MKILIHILLFLLTSGRAMYGLTEEVPSLVFFESHILQNNFAQAQTLLQKAPIDVLRSYQNVIKRNLNILSLTPQGISFLKSVTYLFPSYMHEIVENIYSTSDCNLHDRMNILYAILDGFKNFSDFDKEKIKNFLKEQRMLSELPGKDNFFVTGSLNPRANFFECRLFIHGKYKAKSNFSINEDKSSVITILHVPNHKKRAHGYGSLILQYVIKILNEKNCLSVNLQASPFDVDEPSEMLPKLVAFYEWNGFQKSNNCSNFLMMRHELHNYYKSSDS